MSKPFDKYDLHEWATDSKRSWELAVSSIRKAGVIAGKYQPINSGEMDLRSW